MFLKFNNIFTGFKSCNENDLSSRCCIGVRKSPWTIRFSSTVWIWLLAQNSKNYSGMKQKDWVFSSSSHLFDINDLILSNHPLSFATRLGRHSGEKAWAHQKHWHWNLWRCKNGSWSYFWTSCRIITCMSRNNHWKVRFSETRKRKLGKW